MTIGTSMFSQLNAQAFSRVGAEIADLQEQISSGKNDPRASADPVRSARLSVAREQKSSLERYDTNLGQLESRLNLTDTTLSEITNMTQRLNEITLRAASSSVTSAERETLQIEVDELKQGLLDLANTRDEMGRNLFGGYRMSGPAFEDAPNGVQFLGDGGVHALRVSETSTLPSGLNGSDAFMSIAAGEGAERSVFDLIDDLSASLGVGTDKWQDTVPGDFGITLDLALTRAPQTWTMTVTGPSGAAEVSAELVAGAPAPMVDAINAASADTGVTATLSDDGQTIILNSPDGAAVSGFETDPLRRDILARVGVYDRDGNQDGGRIPVVAERMMPNAQVGALREVSDHMADLRAKVGSLGAVVEAQQNTIENRMVALQQAIAGLEDLDVAAAITELQSLMLTRDASQQTFARITQTSLFDYIR